MPKQAEFLRRYGPWALVAGASEGLGAAYADQLAGRGLKLLLVARGQEKLARTASALRERHGVEVRTAVVDLASPRFLAALREAAEGLQIGLLVCNAAVSLIGPFLSHPLEEYLRLIDTNCRAHLTLVHWLGGLMARRGRGGILIMSSMAGLQGSALVTGYGASKAFLLNLAEGLWAELRGAGVDVLACCAGPTLTPGYIGSKPHPEKGSALEMRPEAVARRALEALGRGPVVVPGTLNRLARLLMGRLLTRRRAVTIMAASTNAIYGGRPQREGSQG